MEDVVRIILLHHIPLHPVLLFTKHHLAEETDRVVRCQYTLELHALEILLLLPGEVVIPYWGVPAREVHSLSHSFLHACSWSRNGVGLTGLYGKETLIHTYYVPFHCHNSH